MSDGDSLNWTDKPIRADWSQVLKRSGLWRLPGGALIRGTLTPTYQIRDRERQRVEQLQRDRARELAAAMGFRTEISDNHAAKIVEVLAPFIPGLTIASPTELAPVPDWLGARWAQPRVGAKVKWSDSMKRELLADVLRLQSEGRATSDRAALQIIKDATDGKGGPGVSVERLQNILSEARKLSPPD